LDHRPANREMRAERGIRADDAGAPSEAISTVAPSRIVATIDIMPLCGK